MWINIDLHPLFPWGWLSSAIATPQETVAKTNKGPFFSHLIRSQERVSEISRGPILTVCLLTVCLLTVCSSSACLSVDSIIEVSEWLLYSRHCVRVPRKSGEGVGGMPSESISLYEEHNSISRKSTDCVEVRLICKWSVIILFLSQGSLEPWYYWPLAKKGMKYIHNVTHNV